jgi:hypothetical protein
MNTDTPLPFDLPAVRRKKLTVDFDGGNQSSDAGLLLFAGLFFFDFPSDPRRGRALVKRNRNPSPGQSE